MKKWLYYFYSTSVKKDSPICFRVTLNNKKMVFWSVRVQVSGVYYLNVSVETLETVDKTLASMEYHRD